MGGQTFTVDYLLIHVLDYILRYDLVDVTRQSLQVIAIKLYSDLITNYKAKDLDKVL